MYNKQWSSKFSDNNYCWLVLVLQKCANFITFSTSFSSIPKIRHSAFTSSSLRRLPSLTWMALNYLLASRVTTDISIGNFIFWGFVTIWRAVCDFDSREVLMHILNVRETPVSALLLHGNEFSSIVFVFIRLIIIAVTNPVWRHLRFETQWKAKGHCELRRWSICCPPLVLWYRWCLDNLT